jgi:hypothetical protein
MDEKIHHAREKRDRRISSGADPVIAGWQCFLEEMLLQLEHYLIPGSLITFQSLLDPEKEVFRQMHANVVLPPHVCAIFIPPSVLQSMMSLEPADLNPGGGSFAADRPMDAGIVLASEFHEYDIIVNSLLAFPPYTAGIDVYDKGALTAGYSFRTLEECRGELQKIIWTYLHRRKGASGAPQ